MITPPEPVAFEVYLLEDQLAEAWDEVERLRAVVERLTIEKHDLVERLIQQGSDPT
jgi:uncharacterized coiled-coil protein SlyX